MPDAPRKEYPPRSLSSELIRLARAGARIAITEGARAFIVRASHWLFPRPPGYGGVALVDVRIAPGREYKIGGPLSGRFLFPADGLREVRILTVARDAESRALFILRDADGRDLRRVPLAPGQVVENGYTPFRFEPVPKSRGRTFGFEIAAHGGGIVVSYDERHASDRLELSAGGASLPGAIGFQAFGRPDATTDYGIWMLRCEPLGVELERQMVVAGGFGFRPLFSVVMPVFDPDVAWLRAAIESVLGQTYDRWELCIADASTKDDVRSCLRGFAGRDARVRVRFLGENGGIAANSNAALALAVGEFVAFLDHDDTLAPDAFYRVAFHLQGHPGTDIIYTDEDKLDADGNRTQPFFKPDWSPDLLLSCMYTGHLGVYRRSLVVEAGGFRVGFEGSQDYDLVLRLVERSDRIHHVPRILYHWRMAPGSAAAAVDAKAYAYEAAKRALGDRMARVGIRGEVLDGLWLGSYRVRYRIKGSPLVSVVVPTRDGGVVLRRCIDSVVGRTDYPSFEVVVVDNQSVDPVTLGYLGELGRSGVARVVGFDAAFNFSAIVNAAAREARGDVLVFLNDDTEVVEPGWLSAMLEHALRDEVGAVGCKLLYPNGTVQHAGIILGISGLEGADAVAANSPCLGDGRHHGYFGRESVVLDLSAVTAACMMVRRGVFEAAGGFDERLSVAFNDVDFCLRLREKGYLVVYTPYAVLYHHESYSRGYEDTPGRRERFLGEIRYMRQKWANVIDAGDPYYNPNLTLSHGDFRIRL